MTVSARAEIKIHSGGILKEHIYDGETVTLQKIPKGKALSSLSCEIEFYENLRVRDLMKMLLEYPELLTVAPGLDELTVTYQQLPKIGCASPSVVTLWLCRSTLYAYDSNDSLSDSAVFIAAEDPDLRMKDLSTFKLSLENWIDCPIRKGLDSIYISEKDQPAIELCFNTNYTLFDLLLALRSVFFIEHD